MRSTQRNSALVLVLLVSTGAARCGGTSPELSVAAHPPVSTAPAALPSPQQGRTVLIQGEGAWVRAQWLVPGRVHDLQHIVASGQPAPYLYQGEPFVRFSTRVGGPLTINGAVVGYDLTWLTDEQLAAVARQHEGQLSSITITRLTELRPAQVRAIEQLAGERLLLDLYLPEHAGTMIDLTPLAVLGRRLRWLGVHLYGDGGVFLVPGAPISIPGVDLSGLLAVHTPQGLSLPGANVVGLDALLGSGIRELSLGAVDARVYDVAQQIDSLETLSVQVPDGVSVGPLASLERLESLTISTRDAFEDLPLLAPLPRLRHAEIFAAATPPSDVASFVRSSLHLVALRLESSVDEHVISAIGEQDPLRHLELTTSSDRPFSIGPLSALWNLEALNLGWCPLMDVDALAGMDNLRVLFLGRSRGLSESNIEALDDLSSLEVLDLDDTDATDVSMDHLAALPQLQWLSLGRSRVTGAGLSKLSAGTSLRGINLLGSPVFQPADYGALSAFPNLEWLGLPSNADDTAVAALSRLTALRTLHCGGSDVSDQGFASLTALSQLEYLSFVEAQLGDAALTTAAGWPDLVSVQVESQNITDVGLAQLSNLRRLSTVALGGPGITDQSAAVLAAFPALSILSLFRTSLSDAGFLQLSSLQFLAHMSFYGQGFAPQTIERFRQARPGCFVYVPP